MAHYSVENQKAIPNDLCVFSKFGTGTMYMHQSAAFAVKYAFPGYVENNTERLVKDGILYQKS